ncbi:mitochondrial assembly of ribosomal large subunit protein 1 [Pseudophryne corroboree]|uniref:mitochondrial assembly of ribosomal large subunit protein 1 n=1 Tax=Pseudophryne corroboree TaxID=495146 RepID=UPI003082165A
MWAQRVIRVLARNRRCRACLTSHPGVRLLPPHAAASASSRLACPQPSLLPGAGPLRGISSHTSERTLEPGDDRAEGSAAGRIMDEDLPEFNIHLIVDLLRQENGKDLCVIRVPPEMKYVEYFVIVGGTSSRHLQAMAQYTLKMYKYLKEESKSHLCIEGRDTDDWMCIDFGNIVVHFMLAETRETYQLEKLWTLRSHDDQLSQMVQEILPSDFTFGLQQHKE